MKTLFKSRKQSPDMALQITAMADIFVILLVFLLKSFNSGVMTLNPSKGVQLPMAMGEEAYVEALKVEISESAILVENTPVTILKSFNFDQDKPQANGTLTSLSQAIKQYRERQLLIAQANSDVKVDPKILIVADQRAPYATIKAVLASAAIHGYTDFKLAVSKRGT